MNLRSNQPTARRYRFALAVSFGFEFVAIVNQPQTWAGKLGQQSNHEGFCIVAMPRIKSAITEGNLHGQFNAISGPLGKTRVGITSPIRCTSNESVMTFSLRQSWLVQRDNRYIMAFRCKRRRNLEHPIVTGEIIENHIRYPHLFFSGRSPAAYILSMISTTLRPSRALVVICPSPIRVASMFSKM